MFSSGTGLVRSGVVEMLVWDELTLSSWLFEKIYRAFYNKWGSVNSDD